MPHIAVSMLSSMQTLHHTNAFISRNKTQYRHSPQHIKVHVSIQQQVRFEIYFNVNTTLTFATTTTALQNSNTTAESNTKESKIRAEVTRRIKDLGRAGRPRDAIAELAAMARLGVQPDTQSATALLDACMRCNKIEMAESVFQELFSGLLSPDEVAFCVMIRGYGDADPPRWTSISQSLASMERDYGIMPTVLTYNVLLEVCSRTNDEDRGEEIVSRMHAAGIEPDDFTMEAVRQRKSLRSLVKRTFMY